MKQWINNFNKLKSEHIKLTLVGLILFTLPLTNGLNSIALISAFVFTLFFSDYSYIKKNIRYYFVSIGLFFLQAFSLILSFDKGEALSKLIMFLPFLAFPIIFSSLKSQQKAYNFKLFNFLFLGVLLISIYAVFKSIYDIIHLDFRFDYGYGPNLIIDHSIHHVYLTLFILIAIINTSMSTIKYLHKWAYYLFSFFLISLIFYLSSRIGIICSIIIVPILIIYRFNVLQGAIQGYKLYYFIIGFIIISCIILISIDYTRDKLLYTYFELNNIITTDKPFNGIGYRLVIWECAWDGIINNPFFGYGIGDAQSYLNECFSSKNMEQLIGYNAHNQYLQFALHYGLVATVVVMYFFTRILILVFKQKQFLLFISFLLLLIFWLTESMLNRQWGVVLFSLLLNYSLFRVNYRNQWKSQMH